MVFLLAPVSRFIVNYGVRADGTDDLVRVAGQLWPRKLFRCLSIHGVLLAVVFVVGQMVTHCSDVSGAMASFTWCESSLVVGLKQLLVDGLWRSFFLFEFGLASAQVRVLLSSDSKCVSSWAEAVHTAWNEQWVTKWLLPVGLILFGLGTATVPARNAIYFGSPLAIHKTGYDMYTLGASAIFLGVLLSPQEVRTMLSNFSFLGNISFSIYLLHMGVIWTIGMPLYVWLDGSLPHAVMFPLIMTICAGPLYVLSHIFWLAIEEPLGVRLPQQAFAGLKWLVHESRKPKEAPKAPPLSCSALNNALEKAAVALAA